MGHGEPGRKLRKRRHFAPQPDVEAGLNLHDIRDGVDFTLRRHLERVGSGTPLATPIFESLEQAIYSWDHSETSWESPECSSSASPSTSTCTSSGRSASSSSHCSLALPEISSSLGHRGDSVEESLSEAVSCALQLVEEREELVSTDKDDKKGNMTGVGAHHGFDDVRSPYQSMTSTHFPDPPIHSHHRRTGASDEHITSTVPTESPTSEKSYFPPVPPRSRPSLPNGLEEPWEH